MTLRPGKRAVGPVLAKSAQGNRPGRKLVEHTDDVIGAFDALFGHDGQPSPLTEAWLRFFRLGGETTLTNFLRNGRAAAFCHDWGKANSGFQQMLKRLGPQLIRHEHLSAMLIAQESLWKWLERGTLDVPLILAAVVGHHLKARDVDFGRPEAETGQLLQFQWDDEELQRHLASHAATFGLSTDVPRDLPRIWALDGRPGATDLGAAVDTAHGRINALDRDVRVDEPRRRMLWAVRAALIAADSAGSGLIRTQKAIAEWIHESFFRARCDTDTTNGRLTGQTVVQKIIAPRMREMGITETQLNPFQVACGDPEQVPARALLLAPCGSGKTLAAWRWVAARCAERPQARAIFLYPTRGTATEGYRDYVAAAGPDEAALVHGTADLDLDTIHPDLPDEDRINEARLFSLRQWPKRLFSATVDQFLGFLQHGYGPTCHLPLLADSVVVCDEIHSYDRGMFSALIEFLRCFDVPVLCMTATMLEGRRERLLKGSRDLDEHGLSYVNGLTIGDSNAGGESELRKAADHPRYAVCRVTDEAAAEIEVRKALEDRKRVLWVVNNVDRCQQITCKLAADVNADRLMTRDGHPLFCYHGRFRLKDRKVWHNGVVEAFRRKDRGQPPKPVVAVTTQVCEMSLDLDADVLVTEICPGTALVQRMGRCCRDAKAHESKRVGIVIVYEPPGDDKHVRRMPYTTQDMAGADDLLDDLVAGGTISQSKLETLLLKIPAPAELPKACRFTDSGAWAAAGEEQFRDSEDLNRPAVLQNILPGESEADDKAYARISNPKTRGNDPPWRAAELVINVPKSKRGVPFVQPHNDPASGLPKWLHIAINGTYYKTLGFCCGQKPAYQAL